MGHWSIELYFAVLALFLIVYGLDDLKMLSFLISFYLFIFSSFKFPFCVLELLSWWAMFGGTPLFEVFGFFAFVTCPATFIVWPTTYPCPSIYWKVITCLLCVSISDYYKWNWNFNLLSLSCVIGSWFMIFDMLPSITSTSFFYCSATR